MWVLAFVSIVIGIVSILGIAVIENLLNSNVMPLSMISYGFHVTLFISALVLLIYAIVIMIRGSKEGKLAMLGFTLVCLVLLVITGDEAADMYSIFKGDIREYQGYTEISNRIGKRLRTEYSPYTRSYKLKIEKYTKGRDLSLDNGDEVYSRKKLKNPQHSGAVKVRYLPISGYLLDIKGLGENYLLQQKEKLDLLGKTVNIPMGEFKVSKKQDNEVYQAKCKVELIRVAKDMTKFNEYTSQSTDRLHGNSCAVKIRFTYFDFNQEGKDSKVYKYMPIEMKSEFYHKKGDEYKNTYGFIGDNFNGGLHREYRDGQVDKQVRKDSSYIIEGWLELSVYSEDKEKSNEPLYLVLYEEGEDINRNSVEINIEQYLK